MWDAYHAGSALEAQALLEALAKELDKTHPGAAGSLREGLATGWRTTRWLAASGTGAPAS